MHENNCEIAIVSSADEIKSWSAYDSQKILENLFSAARIIAL